MPDYTAFRSFTVRLKHAGAAPERGQSDFIVIVSAANLEGAVQEAAKVVATLNGLVEVTGVEDGVTGQLRT